jgi:predicted Zn-dependent protease
MKKLIISFLFVFVLFNFASTTCFAIEEYGDFTYWNSDSNKIGYFNSSTLYTYKAKTSTFGMTDTNFSSAVSSAITAWSSITNLATASGSSSNYTWQVIGCSRTEGNNLGFPSNANGATASWDSATYEAVGSYNGATKNIYSIDYTTTYIVWDSSTSYKNSDFTTTKWKAIFAHEYGHALGYAGHDAGASSSSKSLMNSSSSTYYDVWGVSTPQTRDKNHMNQMY